MEDFTDFWDRNFNDLKAQLFRIKHYVYYFFSVFFAVALLCLAVSMTIYYFTGNKVAFKLGHSVVRDEHYIPCHAELVLEGKLLDDDNSDDFCHEFEELHYGMLLIQFIFLYIASAIVIITITDYSKFLTGLPDMFENLLKWNMYDKHTIIWVWKVVPTFMIFFTVSAILGHINIYTCIFAGLFGFFYCRSGYILEERSNSYDSSGDEDDYSALTGVGRSKRAIKEIIYNKSIWRDIICYFLIGLAWILFIFISYFNNMHSTLHRVPDYVTFTFIWETIFTGTEIICVILYFITTRFFMQYNKENEDIVSLRFMWNTAHVIHQTLYIVVFVSVMAGLTHEMNFIV